MVSPSFNAPSKSWEFSVTGIWSVPEFGCPHRKHLGAGAWSWLAPSGVCGILTQCPVMVPNKRLSVKFQVKKLRRMKWWEWRSQNELKGWEVGKKPKKPKGFVLGLLLLLPRSPGGGIRENILYFRGYSNQLFAWTHERHQNSYWIITPGLKSWEYCQELQQMLI